VQAAQKIGMDGNDPDLTEGPDGKRFPKSLETAARDEAIRAARGGSRDHVLQDKLQEKEAEKQRKAAEKKQATARRHRQQQVIAET
jgi:hypothetical protein